MISRGRAQEGKKERRKMIQRIAGLPPGRQFASDGEYPVWQFATARLLQISLKKPLPLLRILL